jgi:hypothetical protein
MKKNEIIHSILWRRLDRPGHESACLFFETPHWHLEGCAVFADEGKPCQLNYRIICDSHWHTLSANVVGWVGTKTIQIDLAVSPDKSWQLNKTDQPEVAGCIDLDLNFSPSTNLLPIRRLELAVGQQAEVRAAWLRFPSFTFEPLIQIYRRIDETRYRYESGGGNFITELDVDQTGFVTNYPGIWRVEAMANNLMRGI